MINFARVMFNPYISLIPCLAFNLLWICWWCATEFYFRFECSFLSLKN